MKSEIKQRIAQLNNGEIPDGYKKTDFGVFPCDWATNRIIELLAIYLIFMEGLESLEMNLETKVMHIFTTEICIEAILV